VSPWKDRDKLAELYVRLGSTARVASYFQQQGLQVSSGTINNWRIKFSIPIANESYATRDDKSYDIEPIEPTENTSFRELLDYLRNRPVPIGRGSRVKPSKGKYATELVGCDLHAPFHHEGAWEVFLAAAEKLQPDGVTLNGDTLDLNQLSRFTKKPTAIRQVQADLDWARENVFARVNAVAPLARRTCVLGNHEYERWLRYLYERVPELATLRALDLEGLLGLTEMGWRYEPDGYDLIDGFDVEHGDRHTSMIGGGSAMSARKEMIDTGTSGVTGHTHHLGMFWRNDNAGYRVRLEGGCLCDQDKMREAFVTARKRGRKREDWHLGFAIVYYHPDGEAFSIEPVSIIDNGRRTFAVVAGEEISV
jgi:hypothetical protein